MKPATTSRATARRTTTALVVSVCSLSLAACAAITDAGSGSSASPTKRDDITVGLLLPDSDTARYARFDYPVIKEEVDSLTNHKGKVVYYNAEASVTKQSHQFQQLIDQKVDVVVVDALDAEKIAPDVKKAKAAGIPVIAYDRLAQGPIDAYISHDNELVGEVQGRSLLVALGSKAATSKIVMMNGDPADPNTGRFKAGAISQLNGKVNVLKEYDTEKWSPAAAKANMRKAIQTYGLSNIAAVYSANDGMAGAVIDALKAAGADKIPPVTGQDANLDAVQRIVAGTQYMTVYKPFAQEASNAAKMAVAKVQGHTIEFDALTRDRVSSPTDSKIPAMLVPVIAVTKDNIKDTLIEDDVYKAGDICTAAYASACAAIGLK
ncbi:sugar ABC transporter substrate-binding protein [Streptomyces sp. YIM S03343]